MRGPLHRQIAGIPQATVVRVARAEYGPVK
jgi:hypothetical protein